MSAGPGIARVQLDEDGIEATIIRLRALRTTYEQTIARLVAENAYLKRENAALWETVHELQDEKVKP